MIGAWQIYEHSGNQTFLAKSYEFYKELFWDGIGGKHFGYGYQAVLCLNKMAVILGFFFQKFVDNAQQCFAFTPQSNFPAHNLNFHTK